MLQITEETQTKNINGKNKTYSREFFQGARAIICTYKGEKRNRENLNQVPYIERYGGKAVHIIGCLSLVLGIAILVGILRIMIYLVELNFEENIYTSVFLIA